MYSKKVTIQCEWLKDNRVLVNPDGQVWPCCYLGNVSFNNNHPIVKEYENKKDELNLFTNNNLCDIIQHDWFSKTLPNSWNSENPIKQCVEFCGNKNECKID